MCVRPACCIPPIETISPAREHAARLIGRNNGLTLLVEATALGAYLGSVLIWSSVLSGA